MIFVPNRDAQSLFQELNKAALVKFPFVGTLWLFEFCISGLVAQNWTLNCYFSFLSFLLLLHMGHGTPDVFAGQFVIFSILTYSNTSSDWVISFTSVIYAMQIFTELCDSLKMHVNLTISTSIFPTFIPSTIYLITIF